VEFVSPKQKTQAERLAVHNCWLIQHTYNILLYLKVTTSQDVPSQSNMKTILHGN